MELPLAHRRVICSLVRPGTCLVTQQVAEDSPFHVGVRTIVASGAVGDNTLWKGNVAGLRELALETTLSLFTSCRDSTHRRSVSSLHRKGTVALL